MARDDANKIYSATYSNVPVYEYNIEGNHVMRRRSDDWINATHILKVAEYDKPARTRILEREVQKGVHEKVQGGYGKYQGTWIPLRDGRDLAAKNGVVEKLRPIFDYVPGDRSPPPAPKHATASSKPRISKAVPPARRPTAYAPTQPEDDRMDAARRDGDTPDNMTLASESAYGDYDHLHNGNPRKRKRVEEVVSQADLDHQTWADDLLDYFMLMDSPLDLPPCAPVPPPNADVNRPIDDKGHTALHWAAAMGDIEVVKDLLRRGALVDVQSKCGETPLMRAVTFTNSFDRQNMEKLASYLIRTVNMQEWFGSTVFHHIATTTERKSKYHCARYYMDCLLNKMAEVVSSDAIERVLNQQDQNGDTAVTIAARYGARKCVRALIGRHAAVDIPNAEGETADELIVQLNNRRQDRVHIHQLSSSPFQADSHPPSSAAGGAVRHRTGLIPLEPTCSDLGGAGSPEVYRSEAALTLTSQIIPLVLNKTRKLAASLEAEIAEKDMELAEAERVVAMRQAERDALKRRAEEYRVKELEQTSGGTESDQKLTCEMMKLENECRVILEAEQAHNFHRLLEKEQAKIDASSPDPPPVTIGDPTPRDAEDLLNEKLHLARQIVNLHRDRSDLLDQVVQNMSMAGVGDKPAEYKRLILGALGAVEQDITSILPEIVSELEEAGNIEAAGA